MVTLNKCRIKDLEDFSLSFKSSSLGEVYFSSEDLIKDTFFEFIEYGTILKAEINNKTAGFLCYMLNGIFHSFPYIHIFTIMPEFRGRGVGSETLSVFEKKYIDKSDKVFLVVADFNPEGKQFYIKNGYKQVGKIPDLYKTKVDENLMMKNLKEQL